MRRLGALALLILAGATETQCGPTPRDEGASGLFAAAPLAAAALLVVAWVVWLHRLPRVWSWRWAATALLPGAVGTVVAVLCVPASRVVWNVGAVVGAASGATYGLALGLVLARVRPGWLRAVPLGLAWVTVAVSLPALIADTAGSDRALELWLMVSWSEPFWLWGGVAVLGVLDAGWVILRRRAAAAAAP